MTIWYVRAIYRTNKWNIVSINWFLNAFWPTSLHYHQLVCFLTHFASIYFHASAVTMPSGRSVSILFTKWIFDNLVDPFSKFLLFTSGIRTTRPVHGAPIHTWSKFDLFWKTSTSPSLASSINQSNRKQAADWRKITNLIAIEGMVFLFYLFLETKMWITIHRIVRLIVRLNALSDMHPKNSIPLESTGKIGCIQIIWWHANVKFINKPTKQGWKYSYPRWPKLIFAFLAHTFSPSPFHSHPFTLTILPHHSFSPIFHQSLPFSPLLLPHLLFTQLLPWRLLPSSCFALTPSKITRTYWNLH